MTYQSFITQSLTQASEIARANFGKVSGTTKPEDNNQVLTQTDIEIGHRLIELIQKEYPDHNIIDEEAGVIDKQSEYTWVVDPIDGTSNFANGVPTYGIMMGLLKDSTPIVSSIALPSFQEIYFAEKGKGAWCNDQQIKVTTQPKLLSTLVSYCIDGHQEAPEQTRNEGKLLAEIVLNIRNLRTSNCVFDLAQVAKGTYGAMVNQTSKIWDNVGQQVIIEEAGGIYTDFWGSPMNYNSPLTKATTNFTYCAAAHLLHKQLQTIILSLS